ncbi:TonB-dependent receptor [Rhodoplanes sp. Z2-YC6860]|uniref:TonB-dependent receptor n=1 Tax=Rhodoplanes sp. Z2-YC6860 TaxID=674703 RepID=UPI00078C3FCC|nr:TonB-dependent receptor [Rhodoplanes sp. Z2-YC6860]AMN40024.1 TonB-dependent receptor [Rhodoplanes sp. Z2-YC6860]
MKLSLRALALASSAISAALLLRDAALAQDQNQGAVTLPQINVTAPSPIVHRRPARPVRQPAPAQQAGTAPPAPAPAAPPAQLLGSVPIVSDQFATVTVVPKEEITRNAGTSIGDLLFSKPGITGSSFAPGSSSRPIIRGLDVNRVGIVENGVGGGGVSDLGEDHFVPIDPLSAERVEVIRGPATLRYGSQSIGGVVSASNNRIPDTMPCSPAIAMSKGCSQFETRMGWSSVDKAVDGSQLVDLGVGNFAFHGDVFGRTARDYGVPSYPYLTPQDPLATHPANFNGRQPNSANQFSGWSVGGSYFFTGGYAGIAVTHNDALYHIPGQDGEINGTRIDGHQTKVMSKGEFRPDNSAIEAIRYWAGVTDYKHNEIGYAVPGDPTTDGVRQVFTNKGQEGRLEVQFAPFRANFASITTAVGVQGSHEEISAPSPDDLGSPINGLMDPNRNTRVAGYIFNEFQFNPTTKAQIAGRIEHVNLSGTTPSLIPNLFTDTTAIGAQTSRNLDFTPKSASLGLIKNLPWYGLVGSVTAQYTERAPKPAELFSRGGHDATATFDIGNPNLGIETAKSVEVGLRKPDGRFRFELTGYYTRFDGFIFRRLTGNTCDGSSMCVAPGDPAGPLELKEAIYSQRDTTFRGGEFQFQWDVHPMWRGFWGVDGQYDIVRATFTDGTNVPRIPPQRIGGGVYFRNAEWLARVSLLHAFAQNDIALIGETPTAGYNLLKVELSHTEVFKNDKFGRKEVTVGIVGNNLLNADIRNSVSYTKDEVLMPGAGVRVFANVKY